LSPIHHGNPELDGHSMVGGGAVARAGEKEAAGIIAKAAKGALRDAEKVVADDALKRGESRTAKQVLKDEEGRLVGTLSKDDKDAINAFAKNAKDADDVIKPKLERIEGAVKGTEMAGKEFSTKTEGSLQRKVATDLDKNVGKRLDQALGNIKDGVRYTYKMGRDDYKQVTEDVAQRMKDSGFEKVQWKNSWDKDGYKGINSVWRDPETGHLFEVQFHSFESLEAKEGSHGIYDLERLPGISPELKSTLGDFQRSIFDRVTRPPGALDING
jgi:hypothetical protein